MAAKGGLISDITVGDCLELEELQGAGMRRTNRGGGLNDTLHSMSVFGADVPSTLRAFATQGQLSPEQMLERFGIENTAGALGSARLRSGHRRASTGSR